MINRSLINGRVGKKPELKKTDKGVSWVQFSVATDEYYKRKDGERVKRTDWHDIKAWRGLAEAICTHVIPGQMLDIIGPNRTDVKANEDGSKKYYKYIEAQHVVFGAKPQSYWNERNAEKGSTPPPKNNTAPPPKTSGDPVMDRLDKMDANIAMLAAALGGKSTAAPPSEEPHSDYIPPEDDYVPAYDEETAPPPAAGQQKLSARL